MNRTPVGRPRCSLDLRPAAGGSAQQARRLSVDQPLRSLPLLTGGQRSVSGQLATPLRAITEAHNGSAPVVSAEASLEDVEICRLPRVLIAGAGIGGLVLAVALLKRGFRVQVFERDLTAVRGEGKYRGPIQIQSNALAALEAIDTEMAEQVLENGCITGDRVNGLCDGVTGDWYCKFDTFHPAVDNGLPVTRVISRVLLQQKLAEAARRYGGENIIQNDCHVIDFEETVDKSTGKTSVIAILEDGRRVEGDLLIGADGIWSKVRKKLVGTTQPNYSEYTCYTGISDFTPPDIDTVGYRVFLGNGKYFVSSDVGGGKMQWYGFHKEPAGGKDQPGQQKARLLEIFGHWCDAVTDLIRATPEDDVMRRDIFDRPPIFTWTRGRVALLGDSAHAMQPNLGQGGCMAIEDGYQLALTLAERADQSKAEPMDIEAALRSYQSKRLVRASTIHGLAGMAAIMASTYKAYLGEGLPQPLNGWLQRFKIPHPGRVGGKIAMDLTMPAVLGWVLGGNVGAFKSADRNAHCRLNDRPKAFQESMFKTFMHDEAALLRAARAEWALVPLSYSARGTEPTEEPAVLIGEAGITIGRHADNQVVCDSPTTSAQHACVTKRNGDHFVEDLGSETGTWLNNRRLQAKVPHLLRPGDILQFGAPDNAEKYKTKMYHRSERDRLERAFSLSDADGSGPDAASKEPALASSS